MFGLGRTGPLRQRINALGQQVSGLEGALEMVRNNGWADLLAGFGDSLDDPLARLDWAAEGVLTRTDLENLYQHNGVAAAIVDLPADDATRRWVDVRTENEALEEVDQALSELPLRDGIHGRRRGARVAANRALKLARMTGGAAVIVEVRDGRMPWEPLDGGNLESIERLHIHHAYELWPIQYEGPGGAVSLYQLAPDTDGSTAYDHRFYQVHASRVWTFQGVELTAQRQVKHQGWPDPVLQRVVRDLRLTGFVEEQGARTVARKNVPWFKTANLTEKVSKDGGRSLRKRLQIMKRAMSIIGLIPLDATEDVGHLDASLGGIADLLDRYPYRVAASARIPMTKLYGMSPGGFNATGESDIRLYYDSVDASLIQNQVVPFVQWLAELLMRSHQGPTGGKEPEMWTVEALPLWEPTEAERADTEKTQAEADAIYLDRQVLSPASVAQSRGFAVTAAPPREREGGAGDGEGGEDERDQEEARQNALVAQVGTVRTNAVEDGSRMVVVMPLPGDVSSLVYPSKVDHITMVYVSNTLGRWEEALELVRAVASQAAGGFRVRTDGLRHLVNPQGQTVFYEAVEFDDWQPWSLREELVRALVNAGFPVSFRHQWVPHITLAYADDPRSTFMGGMGGASWWTDSLQVWGRSGPVLLKLGEG